MIVKTAQIYNFCLSSDTTEMRRLRQVRPQDETAGTTASQPAAWFVRGCLEIFNVRLFVYLLIALLNFILIDWL